MAKKNTKIRLNDESIERIDQFARQASTDLAAGSINDEDPQLQQPVYPWEEPYVREDVQKTFLVRMPEPVSLKVTWLSKKLGRSKHSIYLEFFTERLDEEIEKLTEQ